MKAKERTSVRMQTQIKIMLAQGHSIRRNGRPVKSGDLKRLEAENHKLKEVVLNQALFISELKKEMSLD